MIKEQMPASDQENINLRHWTISFTPSIYICRKIFLKKIKNKKIKLPIHVLPLLFSLTARKGKREVC